MNPTMQATIDRVFRDTMESMAIIRGNAMQKAATEKEAAEYWSGYVNGMQRAETILAACKTKLLSQLEQHERQS